MSGLCMPDEVFLPFKFSIVRYFWPSASSALNPVKFVKFHQQYCMSNCETAEKCGSGQRSLLASLGTACCTDQARAERFKRRVVGTLLGWRMAGSCWWHPLTDAWAQPRRMSSG